MNKYFEVKVKCGHVGKGKEIHISFAIKAKTEKEAAKKARGFPRVKHDYKDAIIYVNEIDKERFFEIIKENEQDQYLLCKNKQQQKMYCLNIQDRIIDTRKEDIDFKEIRRQRLKFLNYKIRQQKKIEKYNSLY